MLMGGESNWLRKKKVLAYKGTPLHRLQLNNKEVWYKCILCNVMDRNPAQVRKHTLQVHHDLPRKFQCGHCGQSDEKVSVKAVRCAAPWCRGFGACWVTEEGR